MTRRVRVKRGQRVWFAAGPGFERAMGELSDAVFKVLAYVCLRAERGSGCLEFEREGLSREVGKSRSTLGRCLRELAGKQVCELEPAPNQHRLSRLRVAERSTGRTRCRRRSPRGSRARRPGAVRGRTGGTSPRTSAQCGNGSASRPACKAGSDRRTRFWRRTGSVRECRWKRCGGPSCWAACASR